MNCPICQKDDNRIVDSKKRDRDRTRIYSCRYCGGKFKTKETIVGVKFFGTKGRFLAICDSVKSEKKMEENNNDEC